MRQEFETATAKTIVWGRDDFAEMRCWAKADKTAHVHVVMGAGIEAAKTISAFEVLCNIASKSHWIERTHDDSSVFAT